MNKYNVWYTFIFSILLSIFLLSCQTAKEREYEELRKAWTPEVRDSFIEMGKSKGCFSLKEVGEAGHKTSCYSSSSSFDKKINKWVTECEPLCKREAPECYKDGWDPPKSDRCRRSEEWHRENDQQ
jgi:hypothetical protein